MNDRGDFTITPDDAAKLVDQPGVKFVDSSWYLPAQNRNGREEFDRIRIPGAVFFDIDAFSDAESDLPHMLPAPDVFAAAAGNLGITHTDRIIVYDGPGLFSSARGWWTFRVMGVADVRVLDGGFDRWRESGLPTERGAPEPITKTRFEAHFDADRVRSLDDMRANLKSGKAQVFDARPFDRFAGRAAEPRPGLRSGHIPGSASLPIGELVQDGRLKDTVALRQIFEKLALDPSREAITTCGSGVTAAVISLALATIGHENNSLYDGSWAEWGKEESVPVARWEE